MANVKLVYINGTGGYVQSTSTADVAQALGKLELTGVGGVALDANSAKITSVATPTVSTDAANKAYVDSVSGGFSWVQPVLAAATSFVTLSGAQTIDGVGVTNGSRVLITGQNGATPDSANGIYVVNTAGAWSRSTNVLQDGTAMFVQQGTVYASTQFVLTTNGTIVPGTTPIIFAQFGGGTTYVAGNGIDITGSTISAVANAAAGISVGGSGIAVNADTAYALQFAAVGGALRVKADGTKALAIDGTAGLQVKADTNYALSIDSTAGLRVKADATKALTIDATAGLQVLADTNYGLTINSSSGLRINNSSSGGLNFSSGALQINIYSADELSSSASGLAVVGVPSLFKIGGSATSANVTAANLNTLTDSASITGLHRHSALFGLTQTAAGVAAGNPVYFSNLGTLETAAANAVGTSTVVGVAITTGAASANVSYVTQGLCTAFSGLTTGTPYYLADSGGVDTYANLTSGNRAIRIGYATSGSNIIVNIQDMGVKP